MGVVFLIVLLVVCYGLANLFGPAPTHQHVYTPPTPVYRAPQPAPTVTPPVQKSQPSPVPSSAPVMSTIYPGCTIAEELYIIQYLEDVKKRIRWKPHPAAKTTKCPEWFVDQWVGTLTISPAEQLIINELEKYPVKWEREVTFVGLPKTDKGGNYRMDFLLYEHNIVIEYHGKLWHQDPEKVKGDKIKEKFCIKNGIEYITYSGKQYYNLGYEIEDLMNRLRVKSKCQ
jgi:hypothetical protein